MAETLAVGDSLKAILAAQSPEEFEVLKQVGLYNHFMRALRATGWLNLFLGGLTFLLGMSALHPNLLSNIQVYLGCIIVGQGLWAIIRPSINGFLALTGILIFCGLWNLFITFYNPINDLSVLVGTLGILQFWWAYSAYNSYRRLSQFPAPKPTPELIQQYNTIWEGLARPSPNLSPELVTMQLNRNRHWWNGILLPTNAILANKHQKILMFLSKPDLVLVAENPKAINNEKFTIFAQLEKQSLVGKIYRNSFQQYMAWKGITDLEVEVSKSLYRKRLARKMLRWVMIAIIVGLLAWLACPIIVVLQYGR